MAELDPAVFVLDCLPNMTAADVRERAVNCVNIMPRRASHDADPAGGGSQYADRFSDGSASRRQ